MSNNFSLFQKSLFGSRPIPLAVVQEVYQALHSFQVALYLSGEF